MVGENGASDLDDGELVRRDGAELAQVLVDFAAGAGAGQQVEEGGVDGRVPAILGRCVQAAARRRGSNEGAGEGSRSLRCEGAVRGSRSSHTAGSYNALHGDSVAPKKQLLATRALGDFDPTRMQR